MAAIDGPAGPSMATKSAMDGPAGPVVAGDHLRRDRTLITTLILLTVIAHAYIQIFSSYNIRGPVVLCNQVQSAAAVPPSSHVGS